MKRVNILTAIIISCISIGFSQIKNSENGYITTADRTIRVFLVFAEIDFTNCGGVDPFIVNNGINPKWAAGSMPTFAGDLFDADLPGSGLPQGLVTDFFFQMSFGNYIVLGDYYNNVITIPCDNLGSFSGIGGVINELNALTVPPLPVFNPKRCS